MEANMMSEEIRAKYDRLFDRTVVDGKTIKQEIDKIYRRNKSLGKFLYLKGCVSRMKYLFSPELTEYPQQIQDLFNIKQGSAKRGRKTAWDIVTICNILDLNDRQARVYQKTWEIDAKISDWINDAYRVTQYAYVLENRSHDDRITEEAAPVE